MRGLIQAWALFAQGRGHLPFSDEILPDHVQAFNRLKNMKSGAAFVLSMLILGQLGRSINARLAGSAPEVLATEDPHP
jgi:hypothetical protein